MEKIWYKTFDWCWIALCLVITFFLWNEPKNDTFGVIILMFVFLVSGRGILKLAMHQGWGFVRTIISLALFPSLIFIFIGILGIYLGNQY
jgi:hypothetical protein